MDLLSSVAVRSFNLNGMRREIHPEPSPEELEAIEEALARLTSPPADQRSDWWRAGLAREISEEEELV
jgi:hypothetical protein